MKTYRGFVRILNSTAKTAIGDIGSLIIMLLVLRFFQHAAVTVMADFGPALTSVVPNNELILAVTVCILAPLALFRGPLELYGAGSAVISILMGMGIFNAWFLFALLVVPSMTCISSCVTQSWNMWAVEYNELEPKTFLKNGVHIPHHGARLPAAVLNAHNLAGCSNHPVTDDRHHHMRIKDFNHEHYRYQHPRLHGCTA